MAPLNVGRKDNARLRAIMANVSLPEPDQIPAPKEESPVELSLSISQPQSATSAKEPTLSALNQVARASPTSDAVASTSVSGAEVASLKAVDPHNFVVETSSRGLVDQFRHWREESRGGKYLPRYISIIPKDQLEILNAPTAWQPPLVGQPNQPGDLPAALLRTLSREADLPVTGPGLVSTSRDNDSLPHERSSGEESPTLPQHPEDDSDNLEPSWSPSPPTQERRLRPMDVGLAHPESPTSFSSSSSGEDRLPLLPPDTSPLKLPEFTKVSRSHLTTSHEVESATIPRERSCDVDPDGLPESLETQCFVNMGHSPTADPPAASIQVSNHSNEPEYVGIDGPAMNIVSQSPPLQQHVEFQSLTTHLQTTRQETSRSQSVQINGQTVHVVHTPRTEKSPLLRDVLSPPTSNGTSGTKDARLDLASSGYVPGTFDESVSQASLLSQRDTVNEQGPEAESLSFQHQQNELKEGTERGRSDMVNTDILNEGFTSLQPSSAQDAKRPGPSLLSSEHETRPNIEDAVVRSPLNESLDCVVAWPNVTAYFPVPTNTQASCSQPKVSDFDDSIVEEAPKDHVTIPTSNVIPQLVKRGTFRTNLHGKRLRDEDAIDTSTWQRKVPEAPSSSIVTDPDLTTLAHEFRARRRQEFTKFKKPLAPMRSSPISLHKSIGKGIGLERLNMPRSRTAPTTITRWPPSHSSTPSQRPSIYSDVDASSHTTKRARNQDITSSEEVETRASPYAGVFVKFKETYMDYTGSLAHFEQAMKLLRRMMVSGKGLHRYLFDDAIFHHYHSYRIYKADEVDDCENAMSFYDFYNTRILTPSHLKGVINPELLEAEAVERSVESPGQLPAHVYSDTASEFELDGIWSCTLGDAQDGPDRSRTHDGVKREPPGFLERSVDKSLVRSLGDESPELGPSSASPRPDAVITRLNLTAPLLTPSHKAVDCIGRTKRCGLSKKTRTSSPQLGTKSSQRTPRPLPLSFASDPLPGNFTSPLGPKISTGQKQSHRFASRERPQVLASSAVSRANEVKLAWWKDSDTPFKRFERQMRSLPDEPKSKSKVESGTTRGSINIFSWRE